MKNERIDAKMQRRVSKAAPRLKPVGEEREGQIQGGGSGGGREGWIIAGGFRQDECGLCPDRGTGVQQEREGCVRAEEGPWERIPQAESEQETCRVHEKGSGSENCAGSSGGVPGEGENWKIESWGESRRESQ